MLIRQSAGARKRNMILTSLVFVFAKHVDLISGRYLNIKNRKYHATKNENALNLTNVRVFTKHNQRKFKALF